MVEMKGFIGPESEIFFSEKNLIGKIFSRARRAADPSILGEIPAVKGSQFKWKIGLSPTLTGSENIFPIIFFSENFRGAQDH